MILMKNNFNDFFNGRYGRDELNIFLQYLALIFILISIFSKISIFYSLAALNLFFVWFRILSKNISKRQDENRAFLKIISPITSFFKLTSRKFKDRKYYKYLSCPKCGTNLRVPKGKGKIKVRCKHCQHVFEARS